VSGPVIANVTVDSVPGGLEMHFRFEPTGEDLPLRLIGREAEALRSKAGIYLSRAVGRVPRLNATSAEASNALQTLHNTGGQLALLLAPDGQILALQDAFRAAWPLWEQADWDDDLAPRPIVQMHSREHNFPLELLPIFDFGPMPKLQTHADRVRAATRFLGFTADVRRTLPASTSGDRLIRNDPALPVQLFRHRQLGATEQQFLSSLTGQVRLEGPWPSAEGAAEVRDTLIDALYHGRALNGGAPADGLPVQIQHFACHCDTNATIDDDYKLRFSPRWGRARDVKLGELRQAYLERLTQDRDLRRHRAIVFLNACAATRTDPLTASSFAQWFVGSGHRAFIGPGADVPDGVAAGFAKAFYGRLLEARRPLGEAVVWARRDLLRDFRNPLGLLYVAYGDTGLVVERAHPGIYRA
jgi:hypothetical protein